MFVDNTTTSGIDNKGIGFTEAKNICITKVVGRVFAIVGQRSVKSKHIAKWCELL